MSTRVTEDETNKGSSASIASMNPTRVIETAEIEKGQLRILINSNGASVRCEWKRITASYSGPSVVFQRKTS